MEGTHAPHTVIASLGGKRRVSLPGEITPGALSRKPEVAYPPAGSGRAGEEDSSAQQVICVTVEIGDGPVYQRVRVIAPSIRRVLALASGGKPEREARLVFPIDPEAFFAPGELSRHAPAVVGSPEIYAHLRGGAGTGSASGSIGSDSPRTRGRGSPLSTWRDRR